MLDLVVGDFQPGQVGDAAHRIGIDGHGLAPQKALRPYSRGPFAAATGSAAAAPAWIRHAIVIPVASRPVVPARGSADIVRMDAPNPSAVPTAASRTPLHIGGVGLMVRDLDGVAGYYCHLLGLSEISRAGDTVRLGAGGVGFLELTQQREALPDDAREAGLYHTAFLMPTRADLARFLLHIAHTRVPVTGASDHGVSEAIYLDDPEGNGVEVYADRPPETWRGKADLVSMPTVALNVEDLARAADGAAAYGEAPGGLRVGHIHLRVGELGAAQRFYIDGVGLAPTRSRGGALFM